MFQTNFSLKKFNTKNAKIDFFKRIFDSHHCEKIILKISEKARNKFATNNDKISLISFTKTNLSFIFTHFENLAKKTIRKFAARWRHRVASAARSERDRARMIYCASMLENTMKLAFAAFPESAAARQLALVRFSESKHFSSSLFLAAFLAKKLCSNK